MTDETKLLPEERICQCCKRRRETRLAYGGYFCEACIKWNQEMMEDENES